MAGPAIGIAGLLENFTKSIGMPSIRDIRAGRVADKPAVGGISPQRRLH